MTYKRWICSLLAVLLLISSAIPVVSESKFVEIEPLPIQPETLPDLRLGDVTGDKKSSAADALEVLQYAVGKRTEFSGKPLYPEVADVNGDGQPAAADALEILQAAVGKRTAFTVQELYTYPKATEQEELFDQVFQQGWGYALELVDRIIEEEMNDQTGALYLSAACCSLYMSRVPYYTPWFNQSPVWHAKRLKEIAQAAPERVREIVELLKTKDTVNKMSTVPFGYYGAFAVAYVSEDGQPNEIFQNVMRNLWAPLRPDQYYFLEKPLFNVMAVESKTPTEDWEYHWIYNRYTDHLVKNGEPYHEGFDKNWQAVYDFYADDLQAIRDWCRPAE